MRQVREVLRLKHACGHSDRQIAATVGITWPVPAGLDDVALEARLFSPPFTPKEALRPQPDWARVHAELRRPGVTLLLLCRNTGPRTRRAMATAASAISTPSGGVASP